MRVLWKKTTETKIRKHYKLRCFWSGCTVTCHVLVLFLREAAISGVKAKLHIRDLDYSWVWIHVILLCQSCGPNEGNKSPQPLFRVVFQYFNIL